MYAAHLFVEEVAPGIGWHIAAKINKGSKSGLGYAEEAPVCGAVHRRPRTESDKIVKGSSRVRVRRTNNSTKQSVSTHVRMDFVSCRRRLPRGPGRAPFFLFLCGNDSGNELYTMEERHGAAKTATNTILWRANNKKMARCDGGVALDRERYVIRVPRRCVYMSISAGFGRDGARKEEHAHSVIFIQAIKIKPNEPVSSTVAMNDPSSTRFDACSSQ